MGETRTAAAGGLRLAYLGQILFLVSVVLACLTALGPAAAILCAVVDVAGLGLTVVGLNTAGKADGGYRTALFFTLGVLACDLLAVITGSWVYLLLRSISAILAYMGMAYVCDTTVRLCRGERSLAALEESTRKLYLGCTAIVVLCQGLTLVNVLSSMGGLLNLTSRFVQAACTVYYLYFLAAGRRELVR